MPDRPAMVRLLAFDFGLRTIGVALGQSITGTASPLPPITAHDGMPDWAIIRRLIDEWHINQLVVGLPLNMDDTESDMSTAARAFADELMQRFSLDVALVDERLTTRAVRAQSWKNPSASHGLAAALLAESYLR